MRSDCSIRSGDGSEERSAGRSDGLCNLRRNGCARRDARAAGALLAGWPTAFATYSATSSASWPGVELAGIWPLPFDAALLDRVEHERLRSGAAGRGSGRPARPRWTPSSVWQMRAALAEQLAPVLLGRREVASHSRGDVVVVGHRRDHGGRHADAEHEQRRTTNSDRRDAPAAAASATAAARRRRPRRRSWRRTGARGPAATEDEDEERAVAHAAAESTRGGRLGDAAGPSPPP